LHCEGNELLELEFQLILTHLDEVNTILNMRNDYVEFRVKNGLEAIRRAKAKNSNYGVYIG